MSEYIRIKGILEGVSNMLKVEHTGTGKRGSVPDLLTRMSCAKSMLDGVIGGLTEPASQVEWNDTELLPDKDLSPTANQARDELLP